MISGCSNISPSCLKSAAAASARRCSSAPSQYPIAGNVGLVEVDQPRDEKTSRRLSFYARLGCRKVGDLNYILPLRTHGEPPPMMLLSTPLDGPTSYISRETVQRALERIYESVYHQSPDDPRIAQMLDGVPINLPLVGIP